MPEGPTHRQMLTRRTLINKGADMTERELVALLLTYPIPRRQVEPIARALLLHFGSADAVLSAERNELLAVPGIMQDTADFLKLIDRVRKELPAGGAADSAGAAEAAGAAPRESITKAPLTAENEAPALLSVKQAAEYCAGLLKGLKGLTEERVLQVLLGEGSTVKWRLFVAAGGGGSVCLPTELILANALTPGVTGVVIAHNHPSGSPRPSLQDIEATRMLDHTLKKAGVRLYEHFIVGSGVCYAMLSDTELNLEQ